MTLVLVTIAILALVTISELAKKHGATTLMWRWISGHSFDGSRRTNATWTRRATSVHTDSGTALHWHHMPRLHRAGIRTGSTLGAAGIVWGLTQAYELTFHVAVAIACVGVVIAMTLGIRTARQSYRNHALITPLAMALAPILGIPELAVMQSLVLTPDYLHARKGKIGSLILPPQFRASPDQRNSVEHLITTRMPVSVNCHWHTKARPMRLDIMRAPEPPVMVKFSDMLSEIRAMDRDKILLGVTGNDDRKVWDMTAEEPMAFVSANTRRGKTRLALLIMAQILNRGGHVTAIDPKRVGLDEFCEEHPNAIVHANPDDIPGMWETIAKFRAMMNERIKAFQQDRLLTFPRATLVIDEITLASSLFQNYWDSVRKSGERATPPVWADVAAVVLTGAQFSCNCLIFGQRVDSRVLAGLIDSFGLRLMAGYTRQTYQRLCGIMPMPQQSKTRGRFLYYENGESPVQVQTILGEINELRDFALESADQVGRLHHASRR
jgi:hypothetical protein